MNEKIAIEKMAKVIAGESAIMSNGELDWLIDHDHHPSDVVSLPNPDRVGTLDVYVVVKKDHPLALANKARVDLETSAARSPTATCPGAWDEPAGAGSQRGWYWPAATTIRGATSCAGHYLDYGPGHRRFDDKQLSEPGSIHCVVFAQHTGRAAAYAYVATIEAARAFVEAEAARYGHRHA